MSTSDASVTIRPARVADAGADPFGIPMTTIPLPRRAQ